MKPLRATDNRHHYNNPNPAGDFRGWQRLHQMLLPVNLGVRVKYWRPMMVLSDGIHFCGSKVMLGRDRLTEEDIQELGLKPPSAPYSHLAARHHKRKPEFAPKPRAHYYPSRSDYY